MRVGPGQWRGCHIFTDIIGDGPPGDRTQWRTGGLKMGATYWYYVSQHGGSYDSIELTRGHTVPAGQ